MHLLVLALFILLLPTPTFGQATIPNEYLAAPKQKVPAQPKPISKPIPTPAVQRGSTWVDPITGITFIEVQGGEFEMGCGPWSGDCGGNEKPAHTVSLDNFWLGQHEVTQGQWAKVMGSNPSHFRRGNTYPVENVSWDHVQEFIRKLNGMSDVKYRLPTESEWEYAARSGGKQELYSGGSDLDTLAWSSINSEHSTHPVGRKAPNSLGLYDMSGNVGEWVQDIFDSKAYSTHKRNNPIHTAFGLHRVLRGGSWLSTKNMLRSTSRDYAAPSYANTGSGFRIVLIKPTNN